jgi:tRNA pseudouridine55 synthase
VKVDGKRAYELARKGQEAEIKPKTVEIKQFELTRLALPDIDFRIVCSKGTYIRSLARDLGAALGCGAHLTRLVRTRIGEYRLADAWTVAEIEALRPPRPEPADGASPAPRQRRERIKTTRVGLDFYASQQADHGPTAGPDLPLHPEATPLA